MLGSLAVLVLALVLGVHYWTSASYGSEDRPRTQMVSYALQQLVNLPPSDVVDLPLDSMESVTGVGCVKGEGLLSVQKAMAIQLRALPASIVEEIVESALIEGITQEKAYHNTSFMLANEGTIYYYMCYYNTIFTPPDHYETCILVVKVALSIAEAIVGYHEEVVKQQIGTEPCHCSKALGITFGCHPCPIIEEKMTKRPIFKRNALSMKQQEALNANMIRLAASQVKSLQVQTEDYKNQELLDAWRPEGPLFRDQENTLTE